jgi:hypothetical protein
MTCEERLTSRSISVPVSDYECTIISAWNTKRKEEMDKKKTNEVTEAKKKKKIISDRRRKR